MSINRHELTIDAEQLARVTAGHIVEARSDKDLVVQFVRDDLYDQTPGANGVHLIPVDGGMVRELTEQGGTGWVPFHSQYVFGIYLRN